MATKKAATDKPVKVNKKAMIAAITADGALCEGVLVNGRVPGCAHVGRCALGALLFHGGMTNKELQHATSSGLAIFGDVWYHNRAMAAKEARILTRKYGITTAEQVGELVGFNDDTLSCEPTDAATWRKRAKAVIAFIRKEM